MSTQIAVPEVEIEKIDLVEGFNARQEMDPVEIEQLAATIKAHGVVGPVKVKEKEGGRFDLVYGHRRLAAARKAGLTKVPVTPSRGNPRVEAFYENNQRSDLNPVERALDLRAFAEELGLATNKEIAAAAGKDAGWVGEHLRLLKLPEGVQRFVAEGVVPVEGERCLREVAKVSPRVAECVCELARRRKVRPGRFVAEFGDLLAEAPESRFEEKPTMIPVTEVPVSRVVADREMRKGVVACIAKAYPDLEVEDPRVTFGEAEIDAARAAGCLIEHEVDRGEWTSVVRLITDPDLAADLCILAVERDAAETARREAERERRDREWKARSKGLDPDASEERQAAERKKQHAEQKKRRADARSANEALGRNLIERRGGESRKQHSLRRLQVVARALIEANPKLAARGLRLVLPQLREVELKALKSGERREKVTYADAGQAGEYLLRRIEEAGSVNEGLELLGDAYVAAILADEEALPQSKRTDYRGKPPRWVEEVLAADLKAVRPRPRRKAGKEG